MKRIAFVLIAIAFTANVQAQQVQHVNSQTFAELIKKNDGVILDVRTQGEYSRGHIENSTLISTSDPKFVEKVSLLSKDRPIYVYCLSGSRSYSVVNYLSRNGYKKLYNLSRGLMEWQQVGYKLVKPSTVVASTSSTYSASEFSKLLSANNLVLVDFHAKWCAPCKKMLPVIEKTKTDYKSKMKVLKVDIEANNELKSKYAVQSIPGFVLFKNGVEVWRHTGVITEESLYATINKHL